ncbi:MAG: GIY-YIG nuclease family protein [Candidatus Omnitrophota bacterium]|nr:GIY-YIG nuclease family protein [Candidatus Omnitrophota bacterium]
MYYVYILASTKVPTKIYIGITTNLEQRLHEHNQGKAIYSQRYAPWQMRTHVVFSDKSRAQAFETYLKSGSGFAFMKKRLL